MNEIMGHVLGSQYEVRRSTYYEPHISQCSKCITQALSLISALITDKNLDAYAPSTAPYIPEWTCY